jgi:putative ABC transport system substrate-binding protein
MTILHVTRRELVAALGCAAAWPMVARAQQSNIPVIGFVGIGSQENLTYLLDPFRKGLSEAGYVEGANVTIDYRWANGHSELVAPLAAELVNLRVNVIVGAGTLLPVGKVTTTIPIVRLAART